MSEQSNPQAQSGGFVIPEWTLGWRMQRAMAHAGLQTAEIADEIGVSRSTVSRWINDNGTPPRAGFVKLWALRCGVPYEWLVTGEEPANRPDGPSTQAVPSSGCVTADDAQILTLHPRSNPAPKRQAA